MNWTFAPQPGGILACLSLLALALWLSHRRGEHVFSPIALFSLSQFGLLAFALLGLNEAMSPPRALTWVVIVASWAMFVLGALAAPRPVPGPVEIGAPSASFLRTLLLLAGVYLLSVFLCWRNMGTFPLLANKPALARDTWIFSDWVHLLSLPIYVLPPLLFWATVRSRGFLRALPYLAIAAPVILSYVLVGSRALLMYWSITVLASWQVLVRRVPLLRIGVVILAIAGLFLAVGIARYGNEMGVAGHFNIRPKALLALARVGLQGIYDYAANAYWNLDLGLNGQRGEGMEHGHTWGLSSLSGTLFWLRVPWSDLSAFGWDSVANESIRKVATLNSTTYHWGLYKDFGLVGTLLFSLLWGYLVQLLHDAAVRGRSIFLGVQYGLHACMVFSSYGILFLMYPPLVIVLGGFALLRRSLSDTPLPSGRP